ncbi:hypothetical protein E8E13_003661 [Curvularia kusanoi]|uniref:Uncharacterized protein n=1 Tax=Curvularia kusanoi TaxID=90978 RepID=A0A9P4TDH7_CURKU|nr:hypothetical protein E8E13_003661 [Curvularia kusanoi]
MPSEKIRAAMAVFEDIEKPTACGNNDVWKSECDEWKRSASVELKWAEDDNHMWSGKGDKSKYGPVSKMQAAVALFDGDYDDMYPPQYSPKDREFEDADWYRTQPAKMEAAKAAFNLTRMSYNSHLEQSESACLMRINRRQSPLLRLPGELRNMIYSKLIDGKIDVCSWGDWYGGYPRIQEISFPSAYKTLQQISGQIRNETATYMTHRNKLNVCYRDVSYLTGSIFWPQVEAFKNLHIRMYGGWSPAWDVFTSPVSDIADSLQSICEAGALESVNLMFWPEAREADRLKEIAKELSSLLSRMGNGREVIVKSKWTSNGWILGRGQQEHR